MTTITFRRDRLGNGGSLSRYFWVGQVPYTVAFVEVDGGYEVRAVSSFCHLGHNFTAMNDCCTLDDLYRRGIDDAKLSAILSAPQPSSPRRFQDESRGNR